MEIGADLQAEEILAIFAATLAVASALAWAILRRWSAPVVSRYRINLVVVILLCGIVIAFMSLLLRSALTDEVGYGQNGWRQWRTYAMPRGSTGFWAYIAACYAVALATLAFALALAAKLARSPGIRNALWILGGAALLAVGFAAWGSIATQGPNETDTLASIARDIEDLKGKYPQLEKFSARENLNIKTPSITYSYRTHKARHPGGWTAGVPNPDDDGIWFYIDFHDRASTSQIHTQPAVGVRQCLGDMRVGFLILEGSKTASVSGAIWQVLKKHGVAECPQ